MFSFYVQLVLLLDVECVNFTLAVLLWPAHRKENNGYPDYLCKWQGLPYSECTWEDGELAAKLFQSHIDKHLARNKSQCIPTKLTRVRAVVYIVGNVTRVSECKPFV